MMFLLDTNVVSEMRKYGDKRIDSNVAQWATLHDASMFFISAITVMELELGILLLERRDPAQGGRLRAWFERRVLVEFSDRIVSVDAAVARRCAGLHVPNPCSERDALIAATALVHGMTVVSRNVADFEATGVPLLNPWDPR